MQAASSTDNLKETAEYYVEALSLGLVSADEAVAWCDEVIAAHPDPPLAIIRASMACRQGAWEVSDALHELEGEPDGRAVYRRLFARLHSLLSNDQRELPGILRALGILTPDWSQVSDEVNGELRFFVEIGYLLREEPETDEMEAFRAEQTEAILNFLAHAARGEATNYAQQTVLFAPSSTKASGLAYAWLIVGCFGTFVVLLALQNLSPA